jgi:hypothetical protein
LSNRKQTERGGSNSGTDVAMKAHQKAKQLQGEIEQESKGNGIKLRRSSSFDLYIDTNIAQNNNEKNLTIAVDKEPATHDYRHNHRLQDLSQGQRNGKSFTSTVVSEPVSESTSKTTSRQYELDYPLATGIADYCLVFGII